MPTERYSLALFPRLRRGADLLPEPMYFDNLGDAVDERRRHPDCAFEIRDHDDDLRIVDQGY